MSFNVALGAPSIDPGVINEQNTSQQAAGNVLDPHKFFPSLGRRNTPNGRWVENPSGSREEIYKSLSHWDISISIFLRLSSGRTHLELIRKSEVNGHKR